MSTTRQAVHISHKAIIIKVGLEQLVRSVILLRQCADADSAAWRNVTLLVHVFETITVGMETSTTTEWCVVPAAGCCRTRILK